MYSSVGAAQRGMGQKHFESKWIIEQHIHSLDLPYTILRPFLKISKGASTDRGG
jgi:uncharacterized protein YbjT (DUF2867 family)